MSSVFVEKLRMSNAFVIVNESRGFVIACAFKNFIISKKYNLFYIFIKTLD